MKQRPVHGSTSSLFLIELIIAAGFLSLTAAACVRLYLYAQELSEESSDVTHAVNEAQNMAESYLAGDGTLADGIRLYAETAGMSEETAARMSVETENVTQEAASVLSVPAAAQITETSFGYDENWTLISFSETAGCSYVMTVTLEENPDAAGTSVLHICVVKDTEEDDVLFELETARYLSGGVQDDNSEAHNNAEAAQDDAGGTQSEADGALDDAGTGGKEAS